MTGAAGGSESTSAVVVEPDPGARADPSGMRPDTVDGPAPDGGTGADATTGDRGGALRHTALRLLVAGAVYLALSVGLWWHVWTRSPSGVMTCDCTDAGRTVWYLEWSAFAVTHGHGLLYTNWLFHPVGLNLLADTSVPAIGLVLTPVTLAFGPVTAMNVASTLIPVLTALSMYWLLQRWVRWQPAAFVGGLAYGFSAAVVVQLAFGWLNLACLALFPLMVACLDELLVRQRRGPVRVGVVLAVLVAVEFLISTEAVLIVAVSGVVSVALVTGYAAVRHPEELARRWRHVVVGLGSALAASAVLLAYPVWFFLAGPAHLDGMVWTTNVPGDLGNTVGNLWSQVGQWGPVSSRFLAAEVPLLGGYRGPTLPAASYLGPGLLAVIVVGALVWRSDRRLWFFGALGLITVVISLRAGGGDWGPWALVDHLPLFDNVVQSRFDAVFGLCAAAMLAIVVDRTREAVLARSARLDGSGASGSARVTSGASGAAAPASRAARWGAAAMALVVVAVAIVPIIDTLAPNLPLHTQPVTVPRWFLTTGEHLPAGQVVLTYPFTTADSQSPLPWQAISGMHFEMAGGGGPAGTSARAGASRVGFTVLDQASVPLGPAPTPTGPALRAVRDAMHRWGVTMVVVPATTGLAEFQTGRGDTFGVAFLSAVLGSAPVHQDGAWVWSQVDRSPPPVPVTAARFDACIRAAGGAADAPELAGRCVVGPAGQAPA